LLHQVDEADAEELCQDYDIFITTDQKGRHYGDGVDAAKLTGGQHGTASQLIDALLPLVKHETKGKPAAADPVGEAMVKVLSPKPRSKADTDAMMGRISAMLPQFGLTVFDLCEWLQCQPTQIVANVTAWVKEKEGRTVTMLMQEIAAEKGSPAEPEQAALIEEPR